ncbi:MAG: fluoride efflux transporter CrcB [Bacillota bacterium]
MVVVLIGLGGILGTISRYALGKLVTEKTGSSFPTGTLLINISGAFLLTFILQSTLGTFLPPYLLQALTTGYLGAYTTFSTFTHETLQLMQENRYLIAITYLAATVMFGLLAAWAGIAFAALI